MNIVVEMMPFFVLVTLGTATLVIALGALRSTRRAENLGVDRFELLRGQRALLEALREERRVLTEELERERRERLNAQKKVRQLMREHPHLELEREVQRLTEEVELERQGRLHNHSERQSLSEKLERERLARARDQQNVERLELELQELEMLLEERQDARNSGKKGFWATLFRASSH